MLVRDAMRPPPRPVPPDASIQRAAREMRLLDLEFLPVVGAAGSVLGAVTDRDIAFRAVANGYNPVHTTVRDVMTSAVVTCLEEQDVADVLSAMRARRAGHALVLRADGEIAGVLCAGDLAVHAAAGAAPETLGHRTGV